jgi:hypothetical protein
MKSSPLPRRTIAALAALALLLPVPALAGDEEGKKDEAAESAVSDDGLSTPSRRFRLQVEIKANVRTSKGIEVQSKFPFPPEFIPEGETAVFLRTVDEGTSMEVSNVALRGFGEITPHITAHLNLHVLDLYNRNPTSSDDIVSLREAWIRFGKRQRLLEPIPGTTFYAQLGKQPRFTKQIDRHLESYGLWGTAVGRFEEIGLELGGTFGEHVYWRAHAVGGNPLFFRDPNALAGDNGTPDRLPPNPNPELESGFPILYDAKAGDLDLDGDLQVGGGLGFRFTDDEGESGIDVLAWYVRRTLAEEAEIRGSFYQGDLELLLGAGVPLPIEGDDKIEYGINLAGRVAGLHGWGQYIFQEIAGLEREGFEVELGYRIPLNGVFTSGDEPVLNWIEPVLRYSSINNDFAMPGNFVAPSVGWDWRKIDAGFRLGIVRGIDLTVEYAFHEMVLKTKTLHPNEGLLTLRAAF